MNQFTHFIDIKDYLVTNKYFPMKYPGKRKVKFRKRNKLNLFIKENGTIKEP